MKYFIHGDDVTQSRNFLNSLRQKNTNESILIDGKTADIGDLIQAIEPQSLFSVGKLVIIENLTAKKSTKEVKEILSYLSKLQTDVDIILWEAKEIGQPILKQIIDSFTVKSFKTPKIMFKFLENVNPANKSGFLELLIPLRQNSSDEFLFLMMARQLRLLILFKNNALANMPSWIQGKLKSQADKFSAKQLFDTYRKLLMIDIAQKTGNTAFTLQEELDIMLATI